jgi:hypothetical protein
LEAKLANAKIAEAIVEDPAVAYGCAHATKITEKVYNTDSLKIKVVADGAALFRTGWNATLNTVEFLADSAEGTAQFLLLALGTWRFDHLVVGTDEKFKKMSFEAFVLILKLFKLEGGRSHVWADFVVVMEIFQGEDVRMAFCWVVRTAELQL